jgi:hypothetical protein
MMTIVRREVLFPLHLPASFHYLSLSQSFTDGVDRDMGVPTTTLAFGSSTAPKLQSYLVWFLQQSAYEQVLWPLSSIATAAFVLGRRRHLR